MISDNEVLQISNSWKLILEDYESDYINGYCWSINKINFKQLNDYSYDENDLYGFPKLNTSTLTSKIMRDNKLQYHYSFDKIFYDIEVVS